MPNAGNSIFGTKDKRCRIQGVLTTAGGVAFERVRVAIAHAYRRKVEAISDADVVEWMALAAMATLKKRRT